MEFLAIVIAIILLSLWSSNKTLEKLFGRMLENQQKQNELLEEIKLKLDNNLNSDQ